VNNLPPEQDRKNLALTEIVQIIAIIMVEEILEEQEKANQLAKHKAGLTTPQSSIECFWATKRHKK
jgi:hypothetical protein